MSSISALLRLRQVDLHELEESLVYTVSNQSELHSETPSHKTKIPSVCLVQEVEKKVYLIRCPCKIRLKEKSSLLAFTCM